MARRVCRAVSATAGAIKAVLRPGKAVRGLSIGLLYLKGVSEKEAKNFWAIRPPKVAPNVVSMAA